MKILINTPSVRMRGESARRHGFFAREPIGRMVAEHRAGRRDYSLHIWSLLVFQTWMDLYQ